jgi:hypothetical protein
MSRMLLSKVSFFLAVVSTGGSALAQSDELGVSIADGQETQDQKSKRRAYPGGRDEEELKVQASLPQPSRDPDVRAAATSAPVDEPAHD